MKKKKFLFFAFQTLLFSCTFRLCQSRSLRGSDGNANVVGEGHSKSSCPFPEFKGEWEKTVKYPIDIAEGQGKIIGDDFVIISGFIKGFRDTTNQTWALNLNDPIGQWRRMDDYPTFPGISQSGIVAVGSKIYILGGFQDKAPSYHTNKSYVYDHHSILDPQIGQQQWSTLPDLPDGGRAAGGAFYDSSTNAIYYTAGAKRLIPGTFATTDYNNTWKLSLQEDDPNYLTWVDDTDALLVASHVSYVTAYDENGKERHFVFGGHQKRFETNAGILNMTVEFIPANKTSTTTSRGTWVKRKDMPEPRRDTSTSTFAWGCGFITAGGALHTGEYSDEVLYYDIPTDDWHKIGTLPRVMNTPLICDFHGGFMHCEVPFGWPTYKRQITDANAPPTVCVPFDPIRINCGPPRNITDQDGNTWYEDKYYTQVWGGAQRRCGQNDPELLCNRRHGRFEYNIPVPAGCKYEVRFQFYENMDFQPGQRLFDVEVEDEVLSMDIVEQAGGHRIPLERSIAFEESDGMLNIRIGKIVGQGALLSTIEVIHYFEFPAPTVSPAPSFSPTALSDVICERFDPIRINCGPPKNITDENGITWYEDKYYSQVWGDAQRRCGNDGPELLCNRRQGRFSYNIPVPRGCAYEVRFQFFENMDFQPGQRLFDVEVEDEVLSMDIVEQAGGRLIPLERSIFIDESDGMLNIRIGKIVGQGALLSIIEVIESEKKFLMMTDPCYSFDPIRINCGPPMNITDENGITWYEDKYYTQVWGQAQRRCRPLDPDLLCSRRQGFFRYNIPVPSGCDYLVRLQFFENMDFEAGDRVFEVIVEGQVAGVDIIEIVGGPYIPMELSFVIEDCDGMVDIEIDKAKGWGAILSTIEIVHYVDTPEPTAAPTISAAPTPAPTPKRYWEEIDPDSDLIKRHEACSAFANGKLYLIGGRGEKLVSIYDPVTDSWDTGPSPGLQLHHMQCVAVGDSIWIPSAWTRGYPREENVDKIYIYNTTSNTWSTKLGLPEERRRGGTAAVLYDNKLWVSHGNRGGHEIGPEDEGFAESLPWLDYYDLELEEWVIGLPDAPSARDHTGGAFVNGRLCVAGGRNGGLQNWPTVAQTDCYDPVTGEWSVEADIPHASGGALYGTSCSGMLLVAGGETKYQAYHNFQAFDGKEWIELPPMKKPRHGTSLAVDCENKVIYAASGAIKPGGGSGETTSIEAFYHNGIIL